MTATAHDCRPIRKKNSRLQRRRGEVANVLRPHLQRDMGCGPYRRAGRPHPCRPRRVDGRLHTHRYALRRPATLDTASYLSCEQRVLPRVLMESADRIHSRAEADETSSAFANATADTVRARHGDAACPSQPRAKPWRSSGERAGVSADRAARSDRGFAPKAGAYGCENRSPDQRGPNCLTRSWVTIATRYAMLPKPGPGPRST
jgi:hypothetical protein